MSAILAQLGGNPFNTMVGQKIEQATDASLASENWALNMEICDMINDTDEGPKDGVKAIRKRLQQNAGKNYTVVMYTLTVLETCVKNCGRRFHLLITQKDFVLELVKLIGPKNDPPTAVQEKVLNLIQSWADAFRNVSDMQGVVQVYNDLKQKGIEFPMTDMDAMAPIHTPQRMMMQNPTLPRHPQAEVASVDVEASYRETSLPPMHSGEMPPPPTLPPGGTPSATPPVVGASMPIQLTPDQLAKLRSELDVVQGNMKVFGEMLTELNPGGGDHPSDLELLKDLRETCRAMQTRLVQLIDKVANEEVTNELLRVNDEMNNLFLRYERFEKKCSVIGGLHTAPKSATLETPKKTPESVAQPLIDLGGVESEVDSFLVSKSNAKSAAEASLPTQLASLDLGSGSSTVRVHHVSTFNATNPKGASSLPYAANNPKHLEGSDEFDMFAQSRNVSYEQSKVNGSTYEDNSAHQTSATLGALAQSRGQGSKDGESDLLKLQQEKDFDDMEDWLMEKPKKSQPGPDSISSSEFDRFLAERAAAAENLPSVTTRGGITSTPSATGSVEQTRRSDTNSRRTEREEESSLYAL